MVAPFTGAWIEILSGIASRLGTKSLPSRERGLKLSVASTLLCRPLSLPSRERGLKCSVSVAGDVEPHVAPFTGAWIEIRCTGHRHHPSRVAPFTGAWIEIQTAAKGDRIQLSRSLHGSVD